MLQRGHELNLRTNVDLFASVKQFTLLLWKRKEESIGAQLNTWIVYLSQ